MYAPNVPTEGYERDPAYLDSSGPKWPQRRAKKPAGVDDGRSAGQWLHADWIMKSRASACPPSERTQPDPNRSAHRNLRRVVPVGDCRVGRLSLGPDGVSPLCPAPQALVDVSTHDCGRRFRPRRARGEKILTKLGHQIGVIGWGGWGGVSVGEVKESTLFGRSKTICPFFASSFSGAVKEQRIKER